MVFITSQRLRKSHKNTEKLLVVATSCISFHEKCSKSWYHINCFNKQTVAEVRGSYRREFSAEISGGTLKCLQSPLSKKIKIQNDLGKNILERWSAVDRMMFSTEDFRRFKKNPDRQDDGFLSGMSLASRAPANTGRWEFISLFLSKEPSGISVFNKYLTRKKSGQAEWCPESSCLP